MKTQALIFCVLLATLAVDGRAQTDPDRAHNLVYVSWGDQIMMARGDAQLDTAGKIQRSMRSWKTNHAIDTVLWRASAVYIKRFYKRRSGTSDYSNRSRALKRRIFAEFDPITTARQAAAENDLQFLIYMTFLDHGAPMSVLYGGKTPFPWQDRFTIEHPEYQVVDREGNYHYGVLQMAYPEARQLMVDRITSFVDEFNTDGVYVCSRTHSLPALHADQFGFGEPIVTEMKKRYGINILEDPRFDYKSDRYDPDHELVKAWRRLRGEYLVQFYRELRQAMPDKRIVAGLPRGQYLGPPYGNLYLDWQSIVKEQLVDGIVLGVYSNAKLHPPLYVPHDEIGYLSSEDDDINIPSLEQSMRRVYGPLAERHDVNLYFWSRGYGRQAQQRLERLPALDGYMIWTPSTASGRGTIADRPALSFPGGEMTAEAYLYINGKQGADEGAQRVLSKYGHTENGRHRGWEWIISREGRLQFRVHQGERDDAREGAGEVKINTPEPLPVRRWVHVASVYDRANRQMRLYVDGKLSAEREIPDRPIHRNPLQDLYVGRYGGQDSNHFDGKIDELRLVADALRFDGVPTGPYSGSEPGTVALYHFEELGPTFSVTNAANPSKSQMMIHGGGEDLLIDSLSGFGRALDMSIKAE